MLQAAYGRTVPPRALNYLRRGCEVLQGASDEELLNAAYPFFPSPCAKVHAVSDVPVVAKGLMLFALAGLNDMNDVERAGRGC
jgi:hypothetical protein